jgi:hypothetical protein
LRPNAKCGSLDRARHAQPGLTQAVLKLGPFRRLELQCTPQLGCDPDQRIDLTLLQFDLDSPNTAVWTRSGEASVIGGDLNPRVVLGPYVVHTALLLQRKEALDVDAPRQRKQPGPNGTPRHYPGKAWLLLRQVFLQLYPVRKPLSERRQRFQGECGVLASMPKAAYNTSPHQQMSRRV